MDSMYLNTNWRLSMKLRLKDIIYVYNNLHIEELLSMTLL